MKSVQIFHGLSIENVRKMAFDFAVKLGIPYPNNWADENTATKDWYYSFMRRHRQIALRTPEQLSLQRCRGFNRDSVSALYENYFAVTPAKKRGRPVRPVATAPVTATKKTTAKQSTVAKSPTSAIAFIM